MSEVTEIIRRLSSPLDPQPTGVEPKLPQLAGIRAVLFDVYGTLLISGSGDISLTSGVSKGDSAAAAWSHVLGADTDLAGGEALVRELDAAIRRSHHKSSADFPEVEIRDCWDSVLSRDLHQRTADQVAQLATEYECRVNPIWPMPGLAETLASIHEAGFAMGIISNAQFFTPLAFEALIDQNVAGLGFDERLCVWSYEHLQAKPGRFLYDKAVEGLAQRGIAPGQVLYIGNDILNDIWPASEVGFRTALFAGDARSLRLREDDPRVAQVTPDAVITELRQLLTVLSLADG